GAPIGLPVTYTNVFAPDLHTPEAGVGNIEWNQRFKRRTLIKLELMRRGGSHEYYLVPDPAAGRLTMFSTGSSAYQEFEATTRYLGGERRDLTVSYVWAK